MNNKYCDKKNCRFLFYNLALILAALASLSWVNLDKLLSNLTKLTDTYPQEKVHLHTDKPYYAVGEDIWLKGYVVTAEKNEPSLLSAVLYVDLADEKNVIKKSITLPVVKGMAQGNLFLVDSLTSGKYRLRAYTNYMRNYDEGFFFEKVVEVGNVLEGQKGGRQEAKGKREEVKGESTEDQSEVRSLKFFPEGGSLVSGLRSKVGVKAVSKEGNGVNLSGYILNNKKEKVALFTTEHAGMGAFAFTPKEGENYEAVVTLANGKSEAHDLPKALPSGYVLSVNQVNESLKINIGISTDLVGTGQVHVVAQANGKAYASFTTKADKALLSASIAKKMFPTGMVHITLFNEENKPLAERLVFVNHNDLLNIQIENLTPNASTKQKTNLAFTVKDMEGNPVDGNFSVSVTDVGKVPYEEADETTILSNLLLTSDLKGYVEQPNYYFNNITEDKARQLDQLLLTQGWRRFKWEDIATGKEPDLTYRPEQALEITGKTLTSGNRPLPNARVTLVSSTPGFQLFLDTISDAKGSFVFDRLDIPDSTTFIIQAKGNKDNKNINISIDNRPNVKSREIFGKTMDLQPYLTVMKTRFEDLDKYNVLPDGIKIREVTIKAPKLLNHETVLNVKGSANASGAVDYVMKKDRLDYEMSMLSALRKVPGVEVKDKLPWRTKGKRSFFAPPKPMLIILDGDRIPASMSEIVLETINMRDVEGIEVLTSEYNLGILGEEGGGGAIYITLKPISSRITPSTNIARIKNRGYTITKEFYAPDYDDPKTNANIQDLRTTIYWKPVLETDKEGKAALSYFNAGTTGNYRIIIEGMDRFGNIGRKVLNYEVK